MNKVSDNGYKGDDRFAYCWIVCTLEILFADIGNDDLLSSDGVRDFFALRLWLLIPMRDDLVGGRGLGLLINGLISVGL